MTRPGEDEGGLFFVLVLFDCGGVANLRDLRDGGRSQLWCLVGCLVLCETGLLDGASYGAIRVILLRELGTTALELLSRTTLNGALDYRYIMGDLDATDDGLVIRYDEAYALVYVADRDSLDV